MMPNIGIMQITFQFGPFDNANKVTTTIHLGQSMMRFLQKLMTKQ
jgi:hypothetical protein